MAVHDRSRQGRGRWGEDVAAAHLRRDGFDVVARNWRSRHGELDLIARRDRLVVFCEVKARRSGAYGGPAAAVDRRKQERIRALAAEWLALGGATEVEVRFDVITITGVTVEHFEAAF